MGILYRLLTSALTPLALLRLQRGAASASERARWRERLGRIPGLTARRIWIHAASVGEVNAAQALVRALLDQGESLLVSTMTATGAARCRDLFGQRVEHRYLPLDNPLAVRAWLGRAQPRIGIIVETEIWPELFGRCRRLGIPLMLINARISAPAMARYRRFAALFGKALGAVELALCQSEADAERLRQLGLPRERIRLAGNLKFDFDRPADLDGRIDALNARWGQRPRWTAGSTRPGEEAVLVSAHRALMQARSGALLVLAPRHPERTAEIGRLLDREGLAWCRFDETPGPATQVVLVDRLGVLLACYGAACAGFVGGSLVPLGGHNLLEPAALGKPVLAGRHLEQQAEAAAALSASGGLIQVDGAAELATQLERLFGDPSFAERTGRSARQAVASGRGALATTLEALQPWLAETRPSSNRGFSAAAD